MLNLLKAIPSKDEYVAMDDEQKDFLALSLAAEGRSYGKPKDGVEYHPAEIMALMAAKCPYLMDLVAEFDLAVDWNE
jgi:hypothetical protein